MRLLVSTIAMLLSVPASAKNVKDIEPYVKVLLEHMALTFICRPQIGEAPYQAARSLAADSLSRYIGQDAYLRVDEMDKRFKADTRVIKMTAAECYRLKSDLVFKINVQRAKLEAE